MAKKYNKDLISLMRTNLMLRKYQVLFLLIIWAPSMCLTYVLGNPTLSQKFGKMWHILGEGQTMWLQQHHRLPK